MDPRILAGPRNIALVLLVWWLQLRAGHMRTSYMCNTMQAQITETPEPIFLLYFELCEIFIFIDYTWIMYASQIMETPEPKKIVV